MIDRNTEATMTQNPCYVHHSIRMFNCDNLQLMAKMEDESVDIICTDPPYKYLKNQKLEVDFDEELFFKNCKRVLKKDGFIILFGRGISFYRWNCILHALGFNFKEEIIWNKRYGTSPVHPLTRCHETVSVFSKGEGKINRVKVDYLEIKKYDFSSLENDIKRIKSSLNKPEGVSRLLDYVKTKKRNDRTMKKASNHKTTIQTEKLIGSQDVNTLQAIEIGMNEKSIITEKREHYSTIHPTQKPVRLLERLLSLVIPKDKEREDVVVLDPFGGSFSTMEAVYNMGMQGVSCEIDKEYFEAGKERIESLPSRQTSLFY